MAVFKMDGYHERRHWKIWVEERTTRKKRMKEI